MSPHIRQRVLAEYEERYAPFLSLLAGWKGAVEAHFAQGQDAALARLEEQFFPLGAWNFPAQSLAVPTRPPERTTGINAGAAFKDPAGNPWTAAGTGWIQPTTLRQATLQRVNQDYVFVIEADVAGGSSGPLDLILEHGQIAFVAAPEEIVAALQTGTWWVQTPAGDGSGNAGGANTRGAQLTRYDGYLEFERDLQTARLNQRHLDLWVPPCYPYSRKIVRLHLLARGQAGAATDTALPPDLSWLPPLRAGFRFVGVLRDPARRVAHVLGQMGAAAEPLFYLNPVPVVQTAVETISFFPPFPRAGSAYALRMNGVPDLFAAVAWYNDLFAVPASLVRVPSSDPDAPEPDVEVRFAPPPGTEPAGTLVKLYYGAPVVAPVVTPVVTPNAAAAPSTLERKPLRFDMPFPALGGASVGGPQTRNEWARTAWYQSVLRPPLLTEGDLIELIRQRTHGTVLDGVLRFASASRDISQEPDGPQTHWRSYLWPSLIGRTDSFDPGAAGGVIPAPNYIPLVQTLQIAFERGPAAGNFPAFLLADVANYLASSLSQQFVLSCFRVEGRVV